MTHVRERRWLVRAVAMKVFTAAAFVTWLPSSARADYLPAASLSDTSFMSEMEDVIGYKLGSEGTALTVAQEAALPAALEYGAAETAIAEGVAGVSLASGPSGGWL